MANCPETHSSIILIGVLYIMIQAYAPGLPFREITMPVEQTHFVFSSDIVPFSSGRWRWVNPWSPFCASDTVLQLYFWPRGSFSEIAGWI